MLAGMAALPALALVSCAFDRTTANPISTVGVLDFDAIGESKFSEFHEQRDAQQRPTRDAPRLARKPHTFPKMREGFLDATETALRHGEQLERWKEHDRAV